MMNIKSIATYSQNLGDGDYDIYLIDGIELMPGDRKRVIIFDDSCRVMEKGKQVFRGGMVDGMMRNNKAVLRVSTDSKDSSGRVIDVILLVSLWSHFDNKNLSSLLFSLLMEQITKASLTASPDLEQNFNDAFREVDSASKKSVFLRILEYLFQLMGKVKFLFQR